MKKLISLILVLVFAFTIGTVAYADNDDTDTSDPEFMGMPAENVLDNTYEDLNDEEIAAGGPEASFETVDLGDEEPPKADALPDTGGIPAEVFYAIGALFIVAALILFRKKKASAR